MSKNLGYTRKFIILKKDFSNIQNSNPKGHGKLEIKGLKGNIAISLDNAEENQVYNVALVNRDSSFEIGKVYTEDNGKGKAELAFNQQDLESKGFPMEKINGILIFRGDKVLLGGYIDKEDNSLEKFIKTLSVKVEEVEVVDEIEVGEVIPHKVIEEVQEEIEIVASEVKPVLPEEESIVDLEEVEANEIDVKEDFVPEFEPLFDLNQDPEPIATIAEPEFIVEEVSENQEVEKLEEVAEAEEKELVEEEELETVEEVEVVEATTIESTDSEEVVEEVDAFEAVFEPMYDLSQDPEPLAIDPMQESGVEEIYKESFEEAEVQVDYESLEHTRRVTQKNQTTNYVLNILRFFPFIEPFKINLQGYNWWKIDFLDSAETRGFLPYFSYLVGGDQKYRRATNTIVPVDLMRKYQHYIFGLYNASDEVKYYVYGVPGDFYKEEHPQRGETGFNTWFAGEEIAGYWLLYIDPLTGKVIYPINPMQPTE